MSFKEVGTLRKSGRLDEAIKVAERDLERYRDKWSCSALFWCLNDLYKAQTGGEREETVSRMSGLLEDMGEDDVATKCMKKALSSVAPNADEVREAVEQSRQGDAYRSYALMTKFHDNGELARVFYDDYGWVIYRALHGNPNLDIHEREDLFGHYLGLGPFRPSLLHSLILGEAVNAKKALGERFSFSVFLDIWEITNLREEDWEGRSTDAGHRMPSLVERVIPAYVKEMQAIPGLMPSGNFLSVMDRAVAMWPSNGNLSRYRAMVLNRLGRTDEAIAAYRDLIRLEHDKFYLWNELAQLVGDVDLKIALLCRAALCNTSEDYLGRIRLELAAQLILKGMHGWARAELDTVRRVYQEQGWHLPARLADLEGKIAQDGIGDGLEATKEGYRLLADGYVFSDLPPVIMVKLRQQRDTITNATGKTRNVVKWVLVDSCGKTTKIRPGRFGLALNAPNGQCLDVRLYKGKPVLVTALDGIPDVPWIREARGKIVIRTNLVGRRFGFVDNCYVREDLLGNVLSGASVCGIAICRENKWQCVRIWEPRKD